MQDTPMLFPIAPPEFWKQIKAIIEEVITEKLLQQKLVQTSSHLPEKALLKASDVCTIFQVSKPTLYQWIKQNKLKSFKIKSRRYFTREDIQAVMQGDHLGSSHTKINQR